jgi:hypothetical protein
VSESIAKASTTPVPVPEAIERVLVTGDLSSLTPQQRVEYYNATCKSLGLNPQAQPFAFLRLNGKEVMYAKRGATDQLAAIHRVVREIIEGPKVIDLAGTKIVYCVARASLPERMAARLARATSVTWVKSRVVSPSPKMTIGLPSRFWRRKCTKTGT